MSEDAPSKRWLLDGPPQGLAYDTWKKLSVLNHLLVKRMEELTRTDLTDMDNEQGRMWAMASRRLPM
jgi:hypothetical protein